jgi:hypothetical protein
VLTLLPSYLSYLVITGGAGEGAAAEAPKAINLPDVSLEQVAAWTTEICELVAALKV